MHNGHILKHIEHTKRIYGDKRLEELLQGAGFSIKNGVLMKNGGGEIGSLDCNNYMQIVKKIYGPIAYSNVKVQFILANCDCMSCK